jgi:hypothetical protein
VIYTLIEMTCDRDTCRVVVRARADSVNRAQLIKQARRDGWEADKFHQLCPGHRKDPST